MRRFLLCPLLGAPGRNQPIAAPELPLGRGGYRQIFPTVSGDCDSEALTAVRPSVPSLF